MVKKTLPIIGQRALSITETNPKKTISTRYITDDFSIAFVMRPATIHQSPIVCGTFAELQKQFALPMKNLFKELKQQINIDPATVDQAVLLVRKNEDAALKKNGDQTNKTGAIPSKKKKQLPIKLEFPQFPSIILRFNKAPNQKKLLQFLSRRVSYWSGRVLPITTPSEKQGKQTIFLMGPFAVCFPDAKTVIFSHDRLLHKMLSAHNVKSPLTQQLLKIGSGHDFALVWDTVGTRLGFSSFFPNLHKRLSRKNTAPCIKWKLLLKKVDQIRMLTVTVNVTQKRLLIVECQSAEKNISTAFEKWLRTELTTVIRQHQSVINVSRLEPVKCQPLWKFVDEILHGMSLQQTKNSVTFSIKRPVGLAQFSQVLSSAIRWEKYCELALSKNRFKELVLAMHNYHEVRGKLPSAGVPQQIAKKLKMKAGQQLSWRVRLLPFLGQRKLYQKFKLDEPWDSPHNKKLIPQMPTIFQNNDSTVAKGKTSIHVFVGPNTLFPADGKKVTFGYVTDGVSHTLLAVEAGANRAEFWTKPGGLPFDPKKDPKKELGNINREFRAVYADCRSYRISQQVDSKLLKDLLQRNDQTSPGKDHPAIRSNELSPRYVKTILNLFSEHWETWWENKDSR